MNAQTRTKSWENIHHTPLSVAEENFQSPPTEYASHVIWGWQGNMDIKTIRNDLDSMYKKGFRSVIFEAGYHLPFEYLSDDWFKAIATGVKEAKKRGMKVWIIDEGKYPSGFAGGKFTRERPDLRMQALVICDTIHVKAGEALTDYAIDTSVISAVAINPSGLFNRTVNISDHQITFNAGVHDWKILLVRSDYRTAVTRAVNNPTGGKDNKNSLCDYLNPVAVRQFIDWTHEQYKKYLGKELGTTVLGFRGDEPDYAHIPWTPAIIEVFKQKKGYDPTPHLASLFAPIRTEEEKRIRADYWDIWSGMFADSFFKQQADWCEANGLAHITHLNNEHNMPVCVRAEGDFFRTLSKVQIPGVDAIWNQIWPETVNDFPKLASSVSHAYGKPRAFSESFAAYHISPTIPQAKYVVDHQIVRGINFFEFMFWQAGSERQNWMSDPGMNDLNAYTNRVTYLMSQGIPGARIAMYYPTSTMWLDNNDVFSRINSLTQTLLKHQYDFDYVSDDAFTEVLSIENGYLKNKSGQKYYTLIIPSADAISVSAWAKIEEFAQRGGKVLFWGKKPDMLVGSSFADPVPFPVDFVNCRVEPSDKWSPTVASVMPAAELKIYPLQETGLSSNDINKPDSSAVLSTGDIRYTRRILPDAEIYFLFNEGENKCRFTAEFDQVGEVKIYDGVTGEINKHPFRIAGNKTIIELDMPAWDSRVITIQKSPKEYNIADYGAVGDGQTINTEIIQNTIDMAHRNGGGCVVIPKGEYLSGALFFRQGVNLNLKKDAILRATVRPEDFPIISTRFEGIERKWRCAFLNFNQSGKVKVYGEGIIDGRGVEWKAIPFGKGGRPRLIFFTECDGGSISGLKLRDQASWGVHVLYTDGFSISDLDIRSEHTIPSSDGLDIDSSNDIHIRNVYIDVNDDCISIKSGKDADGHRVARASENVIVENCHFAYGHGGVAIGSEISGSIRNVTIKNCTMDADNWGAIRFKSQPSRGGIVENITFENITLNNTRQMLDINMEWRMVDQLPPKAEILTRLKNIRIINVKGNVGSAGTMHGFAEAPFESDSFYFENCEITAQTELSLKNADAVSLKGLTIHIRQEEN
jgi:hypothetical protein